jgi:transposase
MFTTASPLAVNAGQKQQLEALVRDGNSSQKVALRCRLLLLAHQGVANQAIAQQLGVSRPTIVALRATFARDGMAAVTKIRKRNRRAKVLTADLEQRILETTLKTRPGDGSTHWSVRMLAKHLGISRTIVHRVWQRHDVQPHRVERFKFSNDPRFEEKVRDVVGLYLNPPDRALVLCVDEKSQIQALDRTAPILPLRPGLPERQTHDYKRHGTTTLFAAFNILNGKVIGTCQSRHRSREFVRFLNHLEKELPTDQEVHLIMDNYCTPQKRRGATLAKAEEASPISLPLHAHQQFLVESGRALFCPHHRAHDPPRDIPQRRGTGEGHLPLARKLERRSDSVCLESLRRRYPRQGPPV